MAPRELALNGTSGSDRLFADKKTFDQTYYRYLRGFEGNDVLYGSIGIVKLEGGSGSDTFILSNRAGGTGTTDYAAVLDFNSQEGDTIALVGNLSPGDVEILDVRESDLALLNNSFDPYRVPAALGDSFIRVRATGEVLGVVKSTNSGSIQLSGNITGSLSAAEQKTIAPQDGGKITVQNFNEVSPANGVRIVEYADLAGKDFPAYYLSSGAYSTYAGSGDTYNKFVSFDFTDPPAPYGTYLNGRVGPLQHTHNNELETFFVVSGKYIFTDGMQTGATSGSLQDVVVEPGTLVVGPQGFVHGFRSVSDDGPGKIFSWGLPGGLDAFFQNAGTKVSSRYDQIVPNSAKEASNTAFWAGQRGDTLFLTPYDLEQIAEGGSWANLRPPYTGRSVDGRTLPTKSAIWPQMMAPSITSSDRPYLDTVFGERRRSLVNTAEAGDITGKVAWKGPLGPKQPGGTFNYDSLYFSSGTNSDFTRSVVVAGSDVPETLEVRSPNAFDIIYTLTDGLSLRLYDQPDPTNPSGGNSPVFELDAMTYVQLPEGTRYSLANTGSEDAQALSIHTFNSPIAPDPKISVKKEVLSLDGNRTLAPLEFKLRSVEQGSDNLAQLAVFPTDARGRILSQNEGHHPATFLKPGSNRFKLEALQQAKLVTTLIGNKKIQPNGATSTLSNFTSNNLSFLTVEGTTLADVLSKAQDGNNRALSSLRFGSSAVSLREGVGGGIRINGKNGLGFQLEVKPGSNGAKVYGQNYRSGIDFPNGRFNWNVEENLLGLLDLTYTNNRYSDINSGSLLGALVNVDSITGKTQVSGSASGQALAVGFYQVQDENGGVFDPITMTVIEPTARNKDQYLQAVLITANSAGKGYSQLGSQDRLNTNLEGGYLYAPFVQIMGRTGPELYLPYKEVSADNGQHVVPVANNSWALNTSPDPGRLNVYDTNLSLTLNIAPPFVLPPA